jgi:hypothetical protein
MSDPNGNQRENKSAKGSGTTSGGGRRKRKRSASGGSSGGGNNSRGQSSQGKSSQGRGHQSDEPKQHKGSRHKESHVDLAKFWGDSAAMPEPLDHIREASDVKGVVQSLGRVPLSGQETAAEHWFSLVYERAAMLAGALAAAGDLLPDEEDVEP